MTFKELLRFSYGLFMGTSTPFLKPSKRYLWPTGHLKIDENLSLFLGGSGICGVLKGENGQGLLINTNRAAPAQHLHAWLEDLGLTHVEAIINTSLLADYAEGNRLYPEATVYVGDYPDRKIRQELEVDPGQIERVLTETEFRFGDESVVMIPVGAAYTSSDLMVFLRKRSLLFTGGLFYNHIHPILHVHEGLNAERWANQLEDVLTRFSPTLIVPAEGDIATQKEAQTFLQYLRDLMNPDVEFQQCRQRYDWMEVPGQTSLEENFDLLRENVKAYTTLGR